MSCILRFLFGRMCADLHGWDAGQGLTGVTRACARDVFWYSRSLKHRFSGFSRVPGFQGSRVPGFQGSRVPGFLGSWFLGSWVPGFLGSWVPGFQGSWVPGFRASGVPGFRGSWVPGFPGFRGSWVPGFLGSRVPGFRGSWVPGFRASGVPGFRASGLPGFLGSGVPGFRGSWVPGFLGSGASGLPGFLGSGLPGFRGSWVPGFRASGVPGFRASGLPGFLGSGLPGFRASGLPGFRASGLPGFRASGLPGGAACPYGQAAPAAGGTAGVRPPLLHPPRLALCHPRPSTHQRCAGNGPIFGDTRVQAIAAALFEAVHILLPCAHFGGKGTMRFSIHPLIEAAPLPPFFPCALTHRRFALQLIGVAEALFYAGRRRGRYAGRSARIPASGHMRPQPRIPASAARGRCCKRRAAIHGSPAPRGWLVTPMRQSKASAKKAFCWPHSREGRPVRIPSL